MNSAQYWIDQLNLSPHPEGGYYKETIRDEHVQRAPYSSIYFLLKDNDVSHFHRIDADEVWYHHAGETLMIHIIYPSGEYQEVRLGQNLEQGDVLQFLVPKASIFASSLVDESSYSLVGCMCQPAFDFEHFELFTQKQLIDDYPQYTSIIKKLAILDEA